VTKLRATDGANLGTFTVDLQPVAIAFDGANIWVANQSTNTLSELRASDGAFLRLVTLAFRAPMAVAFDGTSIWVADDLDQRVERYALDGTSMGSFLVGSHPRGLTFDGLNVWVANFGSNTVTKLRASDGADLGTFTAGIGPTALAFDGANAWVANQTSNNVSKR
jgi:DNA-binding beta-propeller fold protein YncE